MNKKYIFMILVLGFCLWAIFYLFDIISMLEMLLSFVIYDLVAYLLYLWWRKLRKKEILNIKDFSKKFFFRFSIFMFLLLILMWWFTYYQNEIDPATMPIYTISNWEKTIVFQSMSHIWTKKFYNNVVENIKKYKKRDFVLFFEWVRPWTKENANWFDKAIWVKFNQDLYKNFSKLYWVIPQDNRKFLWLVNYKDFNIDLSIDDIMEIYNKKIKSDVKNKKKLDNKKEIIDVWEDLIVFISELSPRQLSILRYINKSILNFIIKNDTVRSQIISNLSNEDLFDVILEERNKNLVKEINKSKYDKIIIIYWLMHFKWVFELLKKDDNNWKIIETDYLYPIIDKE